MAISGVSGLLSPAEAPRAAARGGSGFAAALREAVEEVNDLYQTSGQEIRRLVIGESDDLHSTLLAVQRAELAFELMLEVRNKVVQAYQEIMRIQV
jgi:flagellar hook-basal body complex protein FliE